MDFTELLSLYTMSAIYILAGINHFLSQKFYLKITPAWVPYPAKINLLVGTVEVFLGIALLFEQTRSYAAIGIIALLIAIFPANVFHFQKSLKKKRNVIATLIRLPIQALLIYWAYTFI